MPALSVRNVHLTGLGILYRRLDVLRHRADLRVRHQAPRAQERDPSWPTTAHGVRVAQ